MSHTRIFDRKPTGASIGRGGDIEAPTRTISDLVDDSGYLRNRTRILAADTTHLQRIADDLHTDTLDAELRTMAQARSKEALEDLLDRLSDLGFSWRDIARVVGVSVPALRKWRLGGTATGENRRRVATLVAFCDIAGSRFCISDVASWLEAPLDPQTPLTGLDLMAGGRFDLVLQLVRDRDPDPQAVLDEFEPDWRDRYSSPVEAFTGPDGLPGLRLADR